MTTATLLELAAVPQGATASGVQEASSLLKEATYYHGATLGAIRRLLFGDTNPTVLTLLASSYHLLVENQSQLRPVLDRLFMSAPVTMRPTLTGLGQSLTSGDTALGQAGTALQALVGPQIWETARGRAKTLKAGSEKASER